MSSDYEKRFARSTKHVRAIARVASRRSATRFGERAA